MPGLRHSLNPAQNVRPNQDFLGKAACNVYLQWLRLHPDHFSEDADRA